MCIAPLPSTRQTRSMCQLLAVCSAWLATTHCNSRQHTARHYNALRTATHCNTLQHTATQHTATHVSLQHTTTRCNAGRVVTHCNKTYCNTLQHAAAHYTILHHTITYYMLQHPVRCVLLRVAVCCSGSVMQPSCLTCSVLQWQCGAAVMSDMRGLQCALLRVAVCCSGSVMQPSHLTWTCET